jgi:hypothetical protein
MSPPFLARHGVQRDNRVILGQDVHDAVDHGRAEKIIALLSGWIRPYDLKLIHIALVDLGKGGEFALSQNRPDKPARRRPSLGAFASGSEPALGTAKRTTAVISARSTTRP